MITGRSSGGYDDHVKALRDPAPDPTDRDIEWLLADPAITASLEESEARAAPGETAAQPPRSAARAARARPPRRRRPDGRPPSPLQHAPIPGRRHSLQADTDTVVLLTVILLTPGPEHRSGEPADRRSS